MICQPFTPPWIMKWVDVDSYYRKEKHSLRNWHIDITWLGHLELPLLNVIIWMYPTFSQRSLIPLPERRHLLNLISKSERDMLFSVQKLEKVFWVIILSRTLSSSQLSNGPMLFKKTFLMSSILPGLIALVSYFLLWR